MVNLGSTYPTQDAGMPVVVPFVPERVRIQPKGPAGRGYVSYQEGNLLSKKSNAFFGTLDLC